MRFGYGHKISDAFVYGALGVTKYEETNVYKYGFDLGIEYPLTKSIKIGAKYYYTGEDAFGVRRPNQTSTFITYSL